MVADLGVFMSFKLTFINNIKQAINYTFKVFDFVYAVQLNLKMYLVIYHCFFH